MVIYGHIQDGQIVIPTGITLPEGSPVTVYVPGANGDEREPEEGKTLLERFGSIAGMAKDLPPDASLHVDHYLYGLPKK